MGVVGPKARGRGSGERVGLAAPKCKQWEGRRSTTPVGAEPRASRPLPPGWMSRGRHGGHRLPVDIHRGYRDALAFSGAAAPPCSAPGLGRGNGHEHEEVHGAAVLLRVSPQEVSVEELEPK